MNLTSAAPGSAQGLLLAVSDIEAAREELVAHGVDASEGFHCAIGTACRFPGNGERISGPHLERFSYGSFVSFSGPYRLARLQPLPWRQVPRAFDGSRRSIRKSPWSEKESLCRCRE